MLARVILADAEAVAAHAAAVVVEVGAARPRLDLVVLGVGAAARRGCEHIRWIVRQIRYNDTLPA